MGLAVVERRGELAAGAMAAKAKAEVEARFLVALHAPPRNIMQVRSEVLEACKRLRFAERAMYKIQRGKKDIEGFSIRFAEVAVQAMGHILTQSTTIWEDDDQRGVHISVVDLKANISYGKDVVISKTIERRQLKPGQNAISERINSYGDKVYLVPATEDEIASKVASLESKAIRTNGLRLVPADIKEEALDQIVATVKQADKADPKAQLKRICDAFGELNIKPNDLEDFLGHKLDTISPGELAELRKIYTAIDEGDSTWADYVDQKRAELAKPVMADAPKAPAPPPQPNPPPPQGPPQTQPRRGRPPREATRPTPVPTTAPQPPTPHVMPDPEPPAEPPENDPEQESPELAGMGLAPEMTQPEPAAPADDPPPLQLTDNQKALEEFVLAGGFTCGEFLAWAKSTGQLEEGDYRSFADVDDSMAGVLVKAKNAVRAQLNNYVRDKYQSK